MNLIFGTDGIRGIANKEISANLAFFIGKSIAINLLNKDKTNNKVLIAKDTRVSKDMLFCSVSAGIMSMGVDVLDLGVATTPVLSWLTKKIGCGFGVMITASHNPAIFNGIKIFDSNGFKLDDNQQKELELIFNDIDSYFPTDSIGKIISKSESVYDYLDYVVDRFKKLKSLDISVAVDCANGAGSHIIPYVFKSLLNNCEVFNTDTTGENINKECGSINTGVFLQRVKDKFDFGFAFDGDGDRLVVILKNGQILSGEELLYVLARYYKSKGLLKNNMVVTTILTNMGIENALKDLGVEVLRCDVGDRFVLHQMLQNDIKMGAENSGHIILSDINKTSDALAASLMLLEAFFETDFSFETISNQIKMFETVKLDVEVSNRQKCKFCEGALNGYIEEMEALLLDKGRVVVRPSGTESVIRILVEGEDKTLMQQIADNIKNMVCLL